MKRTNLLYWIFTSLFAALMLLSAIPDILESEETVQFINTNLGYPDYFTPFIGVAKILGGIAILIPGFPRIKEWAYAGLAYDLFGALYSIICIKAVFTDWVFMLLPISLGALSYIFYHKKLKHDLSSLHQ
jgi:uncharacterized membrane protein YphA (DoxX/SURF4 family)